MASYKISGLPVRARLMFNDNWSASHEERGGDTFLKVDLSTVGNVLLANAWTVRDEFLKLQTLEDAVALLEHYGPFTRGDDLSGNDHSCELPDEKQGVNLATLLAYRRAFEGFIQDDTPKWASDKTFDMTVAESALSAMEVLMLGNYASPRFTVEMGHVMVKARKIPSPFLDFTAGDIRSAVYASIYIDKMRGLRGQVCQKPGCSKTFLAGDPRKKFCSDACGAYVRVTATRTAAKGVRHGKA